MLVEEITSNNAGENKARYEGTYGFLTTNSGKKKVVEIIEVSIRGTYVVDEGGNKFFLNSDSGSKLEFTQVPTKWFWAGKNHIAFIHRRPERQWKRGICRNNTQLLAPVSYGSGLVPITLTPGRVQELFYPGELDEDPYDKLNIADPEHTGILSKSFAWASNRFYFQQHCIGKVDHNNKLITLDFPLVRQEVSDAIRRNNLQYVVT